MKTALIISYYYPPCNGSAPWRAYSWALYFKEFGIAPTVITRHWDGNEHSWFDYIRDIKTEVKHVSTDSYEIYYLPSKKSVWYYLLFGENKVLKLIQPFNYYGQMAAGIFNPEVDAASSFGDFLSGHLESKKYDYVILTLPPPNLLKLIPVIKKKSMAKIIADFRDIWDNLEPSPNYKPDRKKHFSNLLSKRFIKKWLKHADLITHVTPPFGEALKTISDKPQAIIFNGYDEEYFEGNNRADNSKFTFSMIGSLYPRQEISIMVNGLKQFVANKDASKICINMIGLSENSDSIKMISEAIPAQYLKLSKRLKKEDAIITTVQSDVLFFPAWKGFRGMIGVKPLDYIASGNNVLIAPGDDDIMDELITKTQTGKIANTVEEFVSIMNEWYYEWEKNGHLKYHGIKPEIEFYSRKTQARIFAETLLNLK